MWREGGAARGRWCLWGQGPASLPVPPTASSCRLLTGAGRRIQAGSCFSSQHSFENGWRGCAHGLPSEHSARAGALRVTGENLHDRTRRAQVCAGSRSLPPNPLGGLGEGAAAPRVSRTDGRVVGQVHCPRDPSSPRPASRQPPALRGAEAHLVSHLGGHVLPVHTPPSFLGPLHGSRSGLWMGEDTPPCRVARTACRGPVGRKHSPNGRHPEL